jgi:hypothetical protein
MKLTILKPFLYLMIIVLMLACGLFNEGTAQVQPTAVQAQPTVVEAPTQQSVEPTAVQKYFQEDFNGSLNDWTRFVVDGSKVAKGGNSTLSDGDFGNMSVDIKDGFLVFDLQDPGQWVYETYDAQTYDDVRLDVSATNRGTNDNNISLICRYSPDQGWYEFNIANNGLYKIYYARVKTNNVVVYGLLADGGYNKIKQGKETNELGITCKGRTLTLFINNYKVKTLDDNQYVLRTGKIGLSVSSFINLPATVEFDWAKVSQP